MESDVNGACKHAPTNRNSWPIVVTGSHRSGTTWVGRMLCLSSEAAYVYEPFNINLHPHWPRRHFPFWFQYVCDDNEAEYLPLLRDVVDLRYRPWPQVGELRTARQVAVLGRDWARSRIDIHQGRRSLLKDPLAVFSSEWLARRFGAQVVMMIRHPAGFVSSLKRLDWKFDFSNWSNQPLLMRDYLAPWESSIHEYVAHPPGVIDQAILLWKVIYTVAHDMQDRHPEWLFVRLEDLVQDPLQGVKRLYDSLGLRFDESARAGVAEHSGEQNPKESAPGDFRSIHRDSRSSTGLWRARLTEDEVAYIRQSLVEESGWFYDDSDWRAG